MAFFPKGALALLLVVTPGLAMAIPLPPLPPSTSGSSTAVGGPHRPQVFTHDVEQAKLDRTPGRGPRRPQMFNDDVETVRLALINGGPPKHWYRTP